MPSVSAAVFRGGEVLWQEALGLAASRRTRRRRPSTSTGSARSRRPSPPSRAAAARRGRALARRPAHAVPPRGAHAPTLGRARAPLRASSGSRRARSGRRCARRSREELLAGAADAEQVLRPASRWHYSNLAFALLGEVVARRTGGSWEDALQERVLEPLALARTTPRAESSRRRAATSSSPTATPSARERDVDFGGSGALGKLWSTVGDLARWGSFLAAGDERVLRAGDARRDGARADDGRPRRGWTLGWGPGLELYRSGDHVFAGHGGAMPGFLATLRRRTGRRHRRRRVDEHGRRRRARGARARPRATRRSTCCRRAASAGCPARRRRRRSSRCSAAGGRRATSSSSRGGRAGSRRGSSTARRGGTRRVFEPEARRPLPLRRGPRARRGAALVRDARTAPSRSCTSRPIR